MHSFPNLFDEVLYIFREYHNTVYTQLVLVMLVLSAVCYHGQDGTEFHPDHASRQPTELAWQVPIACIQCWDTPDGGQWTCPKHIEYFIK